MKGLMLVSLSNDADLWARFKLSFLNIATSVVILCGSMSTEFLDQDESEFQVRVSLKYYFPLISSFINSSAKKEILKQLSYAHDGVSRSQFFSR